MNKMSTVPGLMNDAIHISIQAGRQVWYRSSVRYLLILIVFFDLFFIMVTGGRRFFKTDLKSSFGQNFYTKLDITVDWSYAEIFGYLKFLILCLLLVRSYSTYRQPAYIALASVFLIVLLDDSLQIHESFGAQIVFLLGSMTEFSRYNLFDGGFRLQDAGELLWFGLIGIFALILLFVAFRRSAAQHRAAGLVVVVGLGFLAFFAVLVDAVGRLVEGKLISIVEDGGEMLVSSALVVFAFVIRGVGRTGWDVLRTARQYDGESVPSGAMSKNSEEDNRFIEQN